jgi:tetratricopeptide (TPR) repeat protein
LKSYMIALHSELAQDTTVALREFESIIAKSPDTPLRDRSLLTASEIYDGMGNYERAVALLEKFIDDYPKHQLLPDAHRRIGQIYETGYARSELALAKYEDILLMFPHYIFLDEVRGDVSRLREKLGEQ